jgi:hypothetical protein
MRILYLSTISIAFIAFIAIDYWGHTFRLWCEPEKEAFPTTGRCRGAPMPHWFRRQPS